MKQYEIKSAVAAGVRLSLFAQIDECSTDNVLHSRSQRVTMYSLGGRLFKRFCKMFSESSTFGYIALQLPCYPSKQARGTFRKHFTKPFSQPAAPDCIHVATGVLATLLFGNRHCKKLPPCRAATRGPVRKDFVRRRTQ